MQTYVVINHNSNPPTPPTPEILQAWGTFFASIKDSLVDGGRPFTQNKAVVAEGKTADVPHDTAIAYYIVKAESLDSAIELVKGSPIADRPGCEVRVYETRPM